MIAKCPENKNHKEFITIAHVSQDWKVDEKGNFLKEIITNETIESPDKENTWTCAICGEIAIVED